MFAVSRRDFVVSAGLATALGLGGRLSISSAFRSENARSGQGICDLQGGSAEVTVPFMMASGEKPHDPAFHLKCLGR